MSARKQLVFDKMETRKRTARKDPQAEEIESHPNKKKAVKKQTKAPETPAKTTAKPAKASGKPKPAAQRKKGNPVRAEPIHLDGPEFHGPQEGPPKTAETNSQERLASAHLESINQLALASVKHMIQDEGNTDQQEAAELLDNLNAANAQFVITEAALLSSWMDEPTDEERQHKENQFKHTSTVLKAMMADRAKAGALSVEAERAMDADQRANPENQSQILAEEFAERSREYEFRNRMIEDFLASQRAQAPPGKKASKKGRTAEQRAGAKAARLAAAEAAAAEAAEAAAAEVAAIETATHAPPIESADYDWDEGSYAQSRPPSQGASPTYSISEEHSSEDSEEEYSQQDGYVYRRENTHRHGHRDREDYFSMSHTSSNMDDRAQPPRSGYAEPRSIFQAAAQTDAYAFFKGAPALTFPSRSSSAMWLEQTTANALMQGQVIPKLRFDGKSMPSWESLTEQPLGYYVVGATNVANNTTMLRLAYETGGTQRLPPVIFLEHKTGNHRILVMSDAAIASEIVGKEIMKALTRNGKIVLTAPSNPRGNSGTSGSTAHGRHDEAAHVKSELDPLLRILHNDRQKLAKLTNGDPTAKVSNPVMLARIKMQQQGTNLEGLPILQSHILIKLLAMIACTQIDYSGPGSKADAWHIAHFLRYENDGVTMRTFKELQDFQEFIDSIERFFCTIGMEGKGDRVFFRDIFRPMRDNFHDRGNKTTLRYLSPDWMAQELAEKFTKWAVLYTDTKYATMDFEEFKQLNIDALSFDNETWRNSFKNADAATMPIQRVNPPVKAAAPHVAGQKRGGTPYPAGPTPAKRQRQQQLPRHGAPVPAPLHQKHQQRGARVNAVMAPAARNQSICIRHLLHAQDPVLFPDGCRVPPPCHRNHAVRLTAGKLQPQDKADLLAALPNMKGGTFPAAATKYIIANM